MIITGWYEKIFEQKILVPWDTPGVHGAPISKGCTARSMKPSNSIHMGSSGTSRTSAAPGTQVNAKKLKSVGSWCGKCTPPPLHITYGGAVYKI